MRAGGIYLLIFIAFWGCKKITYYPDKNILIEPTRLLAHRGGGNAQFRDNTLEGIKSALRWKDGIEVDVQISKNETVWLSHSSLVEACNQTLDCFAETDDTSIIAITTCNGNDISYTQMEDVFKFMHDSFPKSYISIDLKSWPICGPNAADVIGAMKLEAEVILNLAAKYQLLSQIKIETETASVLNFIRSKNTAAEIYLTSFGDFERAMLLCLKEGYHGISYKHHVGEELTKEKMDLLHRKGLKIMVWNLFDNSEIPGLTAMGVDYIQQDL